MSFHYSLEHLPMENIHTKEQLLELLKEHDYNSYIYSIRTAEISYAITKEMQVNKNELELHFLAGIYHDIGKLGMSYDFINYPDSYTINMYEEMKKHPEGGAQLLKHVKAPEEIILNTRFHHCNYDGSGYPGGLYEEEIPIYARVTRISDSLDAFLSKRCYKDGGPTYEALDDLTQYAHTSYDPEILDYFSIVHRKVMRYCHKNGFDRPSQKIYMHVLSKLYPVKFEYKPYWDIKKLLDK